MSEESSTRNLVIAKNEFLAFLLAALSSIARDWGRELQAAPRGPLGSMARFNCVCEEGGNVKLLPTAFSAAGVGSVVSCT